MASPLESLIRAFSQSPKPDEANFARCLAGFMETGAQSWVSQATPAYDSKLGEIAEFVSREPIWTWREERVVEFAFALYVAHPVRGWPSYRELLHKLIESALVLERDGHTRASARLIDALGRWGAKADDLFDLVCYRGCFAPANPAMTVWETYFAALPAGDIFRLVNTHRSGAALLGMLSRKQSETARAWLADATAGRPISTISADRVCALCSGTDAFDSFALDYVATCSLPGARMDVLSLLFRDRPLARMDAFMPHLRDAANAARPELMARLCEIEPETALPVFREVLMTGGFLRASYYSMPDYRSAYRLAALRLSIDGASVFETLLEYGCSSGQLDALNELFAHAPEGSAEWIADYARRALAAADTVAEKERFCVRMATERPEWFTSDWWEFLASSSKQLRACAVDALAKIKGGESVVRAASLLKNRQADARLGAVSLLARLGCLSARDMLREALPVEKSSVVRREIEAVLRQAGELAEPAPEAHTAADLEKSIVEQAGKLKPPAEWVDMTKLPPLFSLDGKPFEQAAVPLFLLATQAREKTMAVSPSLGALFAKIDRARSGDFALALLNAWLASPQEAKDRWALALAGALGDTRILSVVNSWIPKWCEASRGKLAEYAAQAIALQGSDEALMLLDALATRYRSKQRNIGAAAAAAFQAAASARGLSPDELGDVVVPTFGFDADGVRDFAWEGGAVGAELGVDLKIGWSDPESDKILKGLPASAPDALRSEVKELGKLLREAAKGQAARLELALVRQRRWPVARWRELYETHPVLRAFATRLVWGVYAADGALRRCFRRYPNGLLADAAGGLEELPEADALIGMVHPLELSAEQVAAWRAHLARFKVSPPFAQLDRPVERLDPLHANRRELAVAKDRELGAGTFRSRAERRGWVRGSVVDAGMVAGYFKAFPGAGVEVSLEMEGMYVGIDPMETITLGVARFARADSIKRGSYVYDDPQAGDARVLPFGEVPPVVYSEVMGDLKAIAGIAAATADAEGGEA